MIIERRKYLRWIWFADQPGHDLFTVYLQTKERVFRWTHIRRPFPTMIVDLRKSMEEIRAGYARKAAYKIRRAEKDGLRYEVTQDAAALIELFNLTARAKKLQGLTTETLKNKPDSMITQIAKDGEVLAAHYYLLDRQNNAVLLLYAASAFRQYRTPEKRYLAGRSHRLLFDRDLLYLKKQGFERYDFGGYDPHTQDPGLQAVNKFKEDFGGRAALQYQYYPLWYYALRQLRFFWQRIKLVLT